MYYGAAINSGASEAKMRLSQKLSEAAELAIECGFWFDGRPTDLALRQFSDYVEETNQSKEPQPEAYGLDMLGEGQ